jgi:hypothetical protein
MRFIGAVNENVAFAHAEATRVARFDIAAAKDERQIAVDVTVAGKVARFAGLPAVTGNAESRLPTR